MSKQQSSESSKQATTLTVDLEDVINSLPGHIYWLDRNNVFLGCNDLQAKTAGLASRHDIVGRTVPEFQKKEDAELLLRVNNTVMETGLPQIMEEPHLKLDGRVDPYLSYKMPLRDKHGQTAGIVGISFDITNSKNRERTLLTSLDQLNLTLDTVVSFLSCYVYWKNKNGTYIWCNDLLAKFWGLNSAADVIGKTDCDLLPKELADAYRAADLRVMQSKEAETVEEPADYEGKQLVFLSQKRPMFDAQGNTMGILGVSLDITERKKGEELELRTKIQKKTDDFMKIVKFMETTSSAIAHELRTPLATINLQMDLLESAALSPDDSQQEKETFLRQTVAAAKRIIKSTSYVISDMLIKLRSIASGEIANTNFHCASVAASVQSLIDQYPFHDGEKALVQINMKDDFEYFGNDNLTLHLISNLMKNALRAIKEAGKGEILIELKKGGVFNKLIFSDTALGVDEKFLPHIFERFETKALNDGGIGLGLSFCKMVMQSYGGDIVCESEQGKYAKFILTFPRRSF